MLSHFTKMKETFPVSAEVAAFVPIVTWDEFEELRLTHVIKLKLGVALWHGYLALFTALSFLVSQSFVNVAQVKKILFSYFSLFLNIIKLSLFICRKLSFL